MELVRVREQCKWLKKSIFQELQQKKKKEEKFVKHVHKTETETENRLFVKTETETENRLLSKTETDNKH